MAGESDLQEKTEDATPQRRDDFRKQGQVAQTRELSSALALLAFSFLILFMGRIFIEQFFEIYNEMYSEHIVTAMKSDNILPSLAYAFKKIFLLTIPIYIILLVFAMASTVLQIGFLFTEESIKINFNKMNPVEGFKRLFSLKSLIEGLKAVFKFTLVGLVIYYVLRSEIQVIPTLVYTESLAVLLYVGALIVKSMLAISALMLVLAGFDYLFQRFDMENQMKMTKQEVKEEVKSREGDPLIKARIRKIQKEMSNKRMMNDVPKADVIITNPTHLALALKYDPDRYAAPVLLAKGADHMAQKIRELAKEHGIPIVENKPLARTIFKTLDVGQVIPKELFEAVAEVLAYVFKLRRKKING